MNLHTHRNKVLEDALVTCCFWIKRYKTVWNKMTYISSSCLDALFEYKKTFEMGCHLAPFSISEVHSSHPPLRLVVKCHLSPTTAKVKCHLSPETAKLKWQLSPTTAKLKCNIKSKVNMCWTGGNNKNLAVVTTTDKWVIIEVARQKGS